MERGYVLRGPRSYGQAASAVGVGAAAAAGYFGLRALFGWDDVHLPILLFVGFFIVFCVTMAVRRNELLRVDDEGVRFGEVVVPWASVWHLVLLRAEAGPPQVALRLKRGAPLPAGVDALVFDPRDPLAIPDGLRSDVRKAQVDGEAVLTAAAACAPVDVVLVERVGEREQLRPR